MKFEEAVRLKMRTWPVLYPTRAAVLDGLFMRYGAGNYWTEQGIACVYDEDGKHPLERAQKEHEQSIAETMRRPPGDSRDRALEWAVEYHEKCVATIHDVLGNLEERAQGRPCIVEHHFTGLPTQAVSPVQCVPDSCPADWVLGTREMCALILACPFEEIEDKNLARNQRWAKRILKDLDKRFGKAPLPDASYVTWHEKQPFSMTLRLRAKMKAISEETRTTDEDST